MKRNYILRLQHKDLSLDDTRIFFRGSSYQAKRVYDSLAFVLPSSCYESLWLELPSGEVLRFAKVKR